MDTPISFVVEATEGDARMGRLATHHGSITTPCFMPVGTRAAVKAMAPDELRGMGYRMVLANAYHLAVRPGPELINQMGGIARFMGYDGAILTDSGGYQAMSLAAINSITEEGIRFRSHLDGAPILFTPENTVVLQERLGADIMMALDECTPYPADRQRAQSSLEMTARWAERCVKSRHSATQALFGIVQGSIYPDLRRMSAAQIIALPFDGYAVGGLSVGEPRPAMREIAALTVALLPPAMPRYLMGVGTPQDLLAGIAMGFDMFDCVLPTRNARNGSAFTSEGKLSIKRSEFTRDERPLDPRCDCRPCTRVSRAYLRHLYMSGEILAARALTEHNLYFYARLMREAQAAIVSGNYRAYAAYLINAMGGDAANNGTDIDVV
ncbi:MAG TPA: tRNA guanosine(34) transglycosylase Tgt [Candidatus Binataceae bacterium]|nr:tRNA guanosine(34) transglycosylase Tgt [Candidatus Binataceae bacterium]